MLIEIKYLSTSAFTFCYDRNNLREVWKVSQINFSIWSILEYLEMSQVFCSPEHADTSAEPQLCPTMGSHYFNDTYGWFIENHRVILADISLFITEETVRCLEVS